MVPGDRQQPGFQPIREEDSLEDIPDANTALNLLLGVEDIEAGLRSSALHEMLDYYVSLCPPGCDMAPREAFDPAALPCHLPNIFMVELEHEPDGRVEYRYRMFGAALALLFGAQMQGKRISDYEGPNRAKRSARIMDEAVRLRCPLRSAGHFSSKNGMPVFGESLILPFGVDGQVTHVLADLDYDRVE